MIRNISEYFPEETWQEIATEAENLVQEFVDERSQIFGELKRRFVKLKLGHLKLRLARLKQNLQQQLEIFETRPHLNRDDEEARSLHLQGTERLADLLQERSGSSASRVRNDLAKLEADLLLNQQRVTEALNLFRNIQADAERLDERARVAAERVHVVAAVRGDRCRVIPAHERRHRAITGRRERRPRGRARWSCSPCHRRSRCRRRPTGSSGRRGRSR